MLNRSRRTLLAAVPAVAAVAGLGLRAGPATAQANGYEPVEPPQNTATPGKVEVMEFFWLGCPHCYALEPYMEEWKAGMPSDTVLVREAPPLNPSWALQGSGFYAAEALGHEQPFVEAMFKAIHQEREPMRKPSDMAELAGTLGMDPDEFEKTMASFTVANAMSRASQLAQGAGISGVPAVVINGKYRTGASIAGGNAAIIDVIDRMVAIERKSMGLG